MLNYTQTNSLGDARQQTVAMGVPPLKKCNFTSTPVHNELKRHLTPSAIVIPLCGDNTGSDQQEGCDECQLWWRWRSLRAVWSFKIVSFFYSENKLKLDLLNSGTP